jgi:hypothetical protein
MHGVQAERASRESGVKGAPVRARGVVAIDAGRFVCVQGRGRGREPASLGRPPVVTGHDSLSGAAVGQRAEIEAVIGFPEWGAPHFQQGLDGPSLRWVLRGGIACLWGLRSATAVPYAIRMLTLEPFAHIDGVP